MNDEAIYWKTQNTFYDDTVPTTTQTLRIGQSFYGYMRKIKIYDYPKTLPSMQMMYKTSPQWYKFHWTQPDWNICDVDYNFTWYTSWKERNMWDYDCKTCGGRCYTCSGNDRYRWFSWSETLYRFHEKWTCWPETWGDGFFLGDSHYQWDDGNNVNDDGWDKNCRYEAGFSWIPGTPKSATVWQEIWGDGRKINHKWDDANTASGDGWSSTCAVETGYQCTGGDRNTVDVWWEIWGDGKDLGNYGCDDGNTVAGDGCNASCVVEIGWAWIGGTTTKADTWTEICGDGFRTYAAWDDKNLVNGDGWSSTCTVEFGWQCGSEAPSIWWKISQPSIINSYIDSSKISITFNETVILSTGWTSSDFEFSLSGPLTPYSISWDFTSATALKVPTPMQTVWFSYSSSSQFFGNGSETLTITFKDMTRIQNSAYKFGMINSTISFTVFPQESSEGWGELIFQIIIYFVMAGILGVGILSTLSGHSMAIAWMALSIIQFVNFLPQTMIYAPSWMAQFSQGFDVFSGSFKNGIITTLTINNVVRDDFFNIIDYKFIRAGNISSAILYNAFDLIIVWWVILLIIPIMYAIQRIFFNSNYALKLHIEKFRNAIIYVLVLFSYMRLSYLSILNLRYANLDNDLSIISTVLACWTSLIVLGYPLYEAWNVLQYHREIATQTKPTYFRLYILYSDFGVSNPLQYMYFWQFFLRRFLYALMIIGWPQQEYLTLGMCTLMHIAAMMYVTYVLPFTSRIRNVAVMVAEGGMVIIHGACFALLKDTPSTGLSHYTINAVLFFLVVLVVICTLAVLIVFDSLAHLKKIWKICKREPDDEPDKAILDSFGSDSLTEREISLEDDKDNDEVIELRDPKKEQQLKEEQERIELIKKGKIKKGRPQTPPKNDKPLVSQFGRAPFVEKEEEDKEGEGDNKTENLQ